MSAPPWIKSYSAFTMASHGEREWPAALGAAAYQGVLGEFVRAVEPHTESDPAAVLVQTLACFGNALGRGPHFTVEDTRHGTNLFVAVVGDTAKARKGTALDRSRKLVVEADPRWGRTNDGEGGLSTAEGLVYAVRDGSGGGKERDHGAEDKRLLAAMSEFGETLAKMKREGNSLGATIRNAWDGKTLRIRTRNRPLTATEAHVSIIGHITRADLEGLLETADVFNGFGNRFLWVLAKRSKELPFGGELRVADLKPLVVEVEKSIVWADERPRRIDFDARTKQYWPDLYSQLGRNEGGRVGAIVDRAEPQVRRLALVYAAMDRSSSIGTKHLKAALEVWRYCEQSARYLFADAPGLGVEGRIEGVLRRRGTGWVSRSAVYRTIERSGFKAYELEAALSALEARGSIESRKIATSGRPRLEYRAVRAAETGDAEG